jgi:hypothetical protein
MPGMTAECPDARAGHSYRSDQPSRANFDAA